MLQFPRPQLAALALFFVVLLFMLGGVLPGCSTMLEPLHAPKATTTTDPKEAAKRIAREAIDEVYAEVISLNRVIADNVTHGVWTPGYAKTYLEISSEGRKYADRARALLDAGDVGSADELARWAVREIQRRVAAAASSSMQQQGGVK